MRTSIVLAIALVCGTGCEEVPPALLDPMTDPIDGGTDDGPTMPTLPAPTITHVCFDASPGVNVWRVYWSSVRRYSHWLQMSFDNQTWPKATPPFTGTSTAQWCPAAPDDYTVVTLQPRGNAPNYFRLIAIDMVTGEYSPPSTPYVAMMGDGCKPPDGGL